MNHVAYNVWQEKFALNLGTYAGNLELALARSMPHDIARKCCSTCPHAAVTQVHGRGKVSQQPPVLHVSCRHVRTLPRQFLRRFGKKHCCLRLLWMVCSALADIGETVLGPASHLNVSGSPCAQWFVYMATSRSASVQPVSDKARPHAHQTRMVLGRPACPTGSLIPTAMREHCRQSREGSCRRHG